MSLEENEEMRKKLAASRAHLAPPFRDLGLEQVEARGDGSCQLLAVCCSAEIPEGVQDF